MSKERKTAAEYGRKVFRILFQTRQLRPALRERRLRRCRAWAESKNVQADVVDYLYKTLTGLFEDMESRGELDWLPPAGQAKHLMLLPPRHRLKTDHDLCRSEWMERTYKEHQAREEAHKPVIEAALAMLRSTGLTDNRIANYRSIITAFLNVAEATKPGTAARERTMAESLRVHQQPYIDQALLRRLQELVFTLRLRPAWCRSLAKLYPEARILPCRLSAGSTGSLSSSTGRSTCLRTSTQSTRERKA